MKILNRRNVIVTALAAIGGVLFFWRKKRGSEGHEAPA
jgi:hypothetical protein